MAASASSSQVPCEKYDAFISFRGPDVRFDFLSHLEKELRRKNLNVFVDGRLERGGEISSSLVNAIERSMIALVIFSKDYASSRWCLEELVKIMKCKEAGQQIVIPVFYRVDPSDVRHQKGTYAEAFTLHEEKFKDKVEIWRSVLEKSANLSGYDSSKFRDESKLIDTIVEDVLKELEDNRPIVPNSQLIGSHKNFKIVESLMEIKSQEVRIVGIWGMGGIGKTTLARAIFDKFLPEFEGHCFLENVREKSTKVDGLSSLREELFSKLLDQEDNIKMNHAMIWLQRKKVLIVLDDVDNSKQLKDLGGQHLHLGPGSRVIVTSRDKHILRIGGIHDQFIHRVRELSLEESLKLFSIHAFNQSHPKLGYQELSKMIVAIAKGIPLALEVLGSHFHSRDKVYWESELSKLKRYPHEQIQNILKISYDGLDPMDKEIYLDIAFFFLGYKEDNVTCVLEACGFKAVSGIQNLIDKALIKLDLHGYIVMHDLVREMAEQIVRGENMSHPERRSRLKDAKEIYDVLKSNMGTDEIEGIILDVTEIKYVQVRADIFIKMKNLRFLKFFSSILGRSQSRRHIDLLSDIDSFSDKLSYLHWVDYPLETLPSGFYLENLVELHIQNSNVKRLWDGKQDLRNLKTINLRQSRQLIELPDLSMAYKLESVYLKDCKSLRSLHPSIFSLPSIFEMDVSGCSKLESFESENHLKYFYADNCCLKKLCLSSNKLSDICLRGTNVEILHFPIGCLMKLRKIKILGGIVGSLSIDEQCCLKNLKVFHVPNLKQVIDINQLHSFFDACRNLKELRLDGWSHLSEIPNSIKALTKLEILSLDESAVEILPACVTHLSRLKFIYLKRCKRLKSILGLPPFLRILEAAECTLLETVSSDSLVRNQCFFNFCNCEKLDERSLFYIQELTLSSMTSAREYYDYYDVITCYPGSRVPEWMEYKPMTEPFNAIEFTCNLERSQDLLICCVAPAHLVSKQLNQVHCSFSFDINNQFHRYSWLHYPALNQDHVLLWLVRTCSYVVGIGKDAKIACEFFLEYWDNEEKAYCKVPAKTCGAHLMYYLELESEPGRNRKRVSDKLPSTKQLKNSGVSQPSRLELVTTKY